MEDNNKKSPVSLIPPNYVTIVQLQERWLKEKEQQEKARNQEVKKPQEEVTQQQHQPLLPIIDQPKPSAAAPGGDRNGSLHVESKNRTNARLTEWKRKNKTEVTAAEKKRDVESKEEREIMAKEVCERSGGKVHGPSFEGEKEKEMENIPVRKQWSKRNKQKPKKTRGKMKESDGALHVEESNTVETKGEVKGVAKLDDLTVENVDIDERINNAGVESDCTVGINQKIVKVVVVEKQNDNFRPRRSGKNKKRQKAKTTECEVKQNNPAEGVAKLDNPVVVKASIDDVVGNVGVESGRTVVVDGKIVTVIRENDQPAEMERNVEIDVNQDDGTEEVVQRVESAVDDSDPTVEIEGQFHGLSMGNERYGFERGNDVRVSYGNGRYRVYNRLGNHGNREYRQYNNDGGYRGYNRGYYEGGDGYYNGGGYRGNNRGFTEVGMDNRGGFKRVTSYRERKENNSNAIWVRKEESAHGNSARK